MAIVVEVPGGDAHRVAFACYSGPGRHVGEGAVSIIPEQPVVIRRIRLLERRYCRAVHYVDVRPAVAIVVEDGNAAGHRLDQMLFPGRGVFQNHRQFAGFEANTWRRNLPRRKIAVPEVFADYSTPRVLVTEFIAAALMSDFIKLRTADPQRLTDWLEEQK